MSTQATHRTDVRTSDAPDSETLLARAKAMIPALRERGRAGDDNRRIADESVAEMLDAGLLQMLAPRRFGGSQAGFATFFDAAVLIGQGDGSTAWVFGILGCHHWVLAHFNLQAQETLYGDRNHALFPLTFSGKGGTATPVEGGYRVSGDWGFASGIDFSDWVGALAVVDGSDGKETVNLLIPKDQVELVDDWYVSGMRGTGSRGFKTRDLFVPDYLTLSQPLLMAGRTPGAAALPDYHGLRASLHTVLMIAAVGAALGLARRAIDEFVAFTKGRTGYGGMDHAARSSTQFKIADSMARWDAVHNLMRGHFVEVDRLAEENRTSNPEQRLRYRRDAVLAVAECAAIVDTMSAAAGARAQHASSPFQLIQRDINTARTHVLLDRDDANELYGKYVLGIDLGPVRQ
jgi:3-hydroxy-9,10-secoandrosta-1,3,5(10)-triene-9,17-dione monooxygenase